jgi:deoxyribodipyrimidine photo-lyase
MTTVYLFHRDLRIVDSNALFAAGKLGAPVLPLFVFTPTQVSEKNTLRSLNSIQFMIASLEDLESAVRDDGGKLYFAYGDTVEILHMVHKRTPIGAVVETVDYTPYAKRRTAAIGAFCKSVDAKHILEHDSYLMAPGTVLNMSGKTFQKFTPFYEKARHSRIPSPRGTPKIKYHMLRAGGGGTRKLRLARGFAPLSLIKKRLLTTLNHELAVKGGRSEGLRLLKHLPTNYAHTHDIPSVPTSMLSAHNHYGTVSIREVYHAAHGKTEFIRQLWWRDFYGHIMADFEGLYGIGAYDFQKTAPAQSEKAEKAFRDWCNARTGVPLVDAGMRQLLRTGWMHNRVRLAVASWLVKDYKVHWRRGERFFAQHLVDYDATQNMMNWIWIASALPFAMAPFRRIDPDKTAERFDPDGTYIKTWAEK